MATYYVSQTATNGCGVGSDSNSSAQAQNPLTPWLTLDKFYSSSADGDSVWINDGTYTAATANNINRALTYMAINAFAVTMRTQAGQSAVINSGLGAGKVLQFNGIIFDAQNINNYAHYTDSASVTINWANCVFKDAVLQCCRLNSTSGKYNFVNCTVTGAATDGGIVHVAPGAGCIITIDGLTVNLTNITANAGAIYLQGGAVGAVVMMRNVFGSQINTGSAAMSGITCYNITRLAILGPGPGDDMPRLKVTASAPVACLRILPRISIAFDRPYVEGFRGELNTANDGYGILFGTDGLGGATVGNFLTDPICIGCDIIGNPTNTASHGLMIGDQVGGFFAANRIRGFAISMISKVQSSRGLITAMNDIDGAVAGGAGMIYSKGSTAGSGHFGNRMHLSAGAMQTVYQSLKDNTSGAIDVGSVFAFNTIYSQADATANALVAVGGASDASTSTFAGNNWNLAGGVSGSPFSYQGTTYASVAAWAAAQELSLRNEVPTFSAPNFWRFIYLPKVKQIIRDAVAPLIKLAGL